MRIMILLTCLAGAGCATISNPVSVQGVYEMDAALGIAASALNGYRSLCVQKQPAVYPKCRTVVPIIQSDLRLARGQVAQAIAYVRANPGNTVGLTGIVSQAQASINQLQADLTANGVK